MYSRNAAIIHSRFFLELLRQNGIHVSDAFLFGSYATGSAKEGSDIDVAVVSPDFSGAPLEDLGKIAHSKFQSNPSLDVVPIAERNFSITDPLVKQIVETGERLEPVT
jgi:DNA polymerase sigma